MTDVLHEKRLVQDAVLHLSEIVSQEGPRSASRRLPHLGSVGNKECMYVSRENRESFL